MDRAAFQGHPIWESVKQAQDLLSQIGGEAPETATSDLEAIRYVLSAVASHEEPSDTCVYATTTLNNTNQHLVNVVGELRNYVNNQNIGHLTNASNHGDQVLYLLGLWPASSLRGGAAAQATRTFRSYMESAEETISLLRTEIERIEEETSIRQQEELARQNATEEQVNTLRQTIGSLQSKITADEARLDTALTTNNEAFTEAQRRRDEQYSTWLQEQGDTLEEHARPQLARINEIQEDAQNRLDKIVKLHSDVETVSSEAARAILAKDYGSYSTREWVAGVVAYVFGIALLAGFGIYLIATIGGIAATSTPSWQYVALKLGVTLTAVAVAGVLFQFGSHAISRANTNKRVQLELGAIGTFLADMNDADLVKKAKLDFVERMFGRAWEHGRPHVDGQSQVSISALEKILELVNRSGK